MLLTLYLAGKSYTKPTEYRRLNRKNAMLSSIRLELRVYPKKIRRTLEQVNIFDSFLSYRL